MTVHFVVGGIKKRFLIFRGGVNMRRLHHPDADAFISTAIHVAGVFDRHLRIGGMEASDVLVAQTLLGAKENFP